MFETIISAILTIAIIFTTIKVMLDTDSDVVFSIAWFGGIFSATASLIWFAITLV